MENTIPVLNKRPCPFFPLPSSLPGSPPQRPFTVVMPETETVTSPASPWGEEPWRLVWGSRPSGAPAVTHLAKLKDESFFTLDQRSGRCSVRITPRRFKKVNFSRTSLPRNHSRPLTQEMLSPLLPVCSLAGFREIYAWAPPPGRPGLLPGGNSKCRDVCFRRLPGCLLSPRGHPAAVVGWARGTWRPEISSHGPGPSAAVTELPRAVTAVPAPQRAAGQSALPEPPGLGGRACPGPSAPAASTGQVMKPRATASQGGGRARGSSPEVGR